MHHRIGARTWTILVLLCMLVLGVAIELRLALHDLPEDVGQAIHTQLRRLEMQALESTFVYDADPDPEKVAKVTTVVKTPRNAGESTTDWQARHDDAVTVAMAGKTILN